MNFVLDQANNNWTLMKPNQLCVITMSHDDNNESKIVEISDMKLVHSTYKQKELVIH